MISKAQFPFVALAWVVLSIHPASLVAQDSGLALEAEVTEAAPPPEAVTDEAPIPASEALQPTAASTDLLTVPLEAAPVLGADQPLTTTPVVQSGSKSGLGFMIAGGAAFVAGLLIGGTTGNVIAVGGAVLGVWGIIVYF